MMKIARQYLGGGDPKNPFHIQDQLTQLKRIMKRRQLKQSELYQHQFKYMNADKMYAFTSIKETGYANNRPLLRFRTMIISMRMETGELSDYTLTSIIGTLEFCNALGLTMISS